MEDKRDKIEIFHNALIQHGPLSNRIYLMKLNDADAKKLADEMENLANSNGYTKIFAKVPVHQADIFIGSGYQSEAVVPGFYKGRQDALFLARYFDPDRQKETASEDIEKIIDLARNKGQLGIKAVQLPAGAVLRQCNPDDAAAMSGLYSRVFPSYPFPIDNPDYIARTMREHIVYFGIEIEGKLVSLSSCEMDTDAQNVEMTDFATLPEFRGSSFAGLLLGYMENQMRLSKMLTAYTIARSVSHGINITFARAGYTYGGRLINNTNISGKIESMNVWYKSLH
ncbi:MAG: putative beta-lysine N-acetyltransferase [Phycisphaerae bacterium]|jgi:putative beta-lysine N-acetyltransferase